MADILTGPNDLTPEWLTGALRAADVLARGRVVDVEAGATERQLRSLTTRVSVSYSDDAPSDAPTRLFLKVATTSTRRSPASSPNPEVVFYTSVANQMPAPPVPRCFHAAESAEEERLHLLLEDHSDTHGNSEWPIPPSEGHCHDFVEALAVFHAWWWDREALDRASRRPGAADFTDMAKALDAQLPRLFDVIGDRLAKTDRDSYERVVHGAAPLLAERFASNGALTLAHGDAHFWNVLLPFERGASGPLFVDWADNQIAPGVMDLAYAIALHWHPERRARLEQPLLRRYHRTLQANGVSKYSWDDLLADYRLFALRNMLIPVGQWDRGLPAYIWWGHLERGLLAARDLQAFDLI
jgi:hypothetical protein